MLSAICRRRNLSWPFGKLAYRNVAFTAPGLVHDLADQLSAGCIDILPPGGAHGDVVAGVVQHILEAADGVVARSEEHTSELQSRENLVCRLLLEKKKDCV